MEAAHHGESVTDKRDLYWWRQPEGDFYPAGQQWELVGTFENAREARTAFNRLCQYNYTGRVVLGTIITAGAHFEGA